MTDTTMAPAAPGLDASGMQEVVRALMAAKQAHDFDALLALYHPDVVVEQTSIGFASQGHEALRPGLELWATVFPDYERDFEGTAVQGDTLMSWGTARATLTGEFNGYRANGKRAEVMTFVEFTFDEGLIVRERHFWDIATVCHASGIPVEAIKPLAPTDQTR